MCSEQRYQQCGVGEKQHCMCSQNGQSEKLTTFCQLYGAHCVGCSYLKVESVSKVVPSKKQQLKGFVKSVQFF